MADDESVTDMRMGAVLMHELFTSYLAAGFTTEQALALVQTHLSAAVQANGNS